MNNTDDNIYIESFSEDRIELSNGIILTCDLDKDQSFDYEIIKKIIED